MSACNKCVDGASFFCDVTTGESLDCPFCKDARHAALVADLRAKLALAEELARAVGQCNTAAPAVHAAYAAYRAACPKKEGET